VTVALGSTDAVDQDPTHNICTWLSNSMMDQYRILLRVSILKYPNGSSNNFCGLVSKVV
jgi:hypothetical protein